MSNNSDNTYSTDGASYHQDDYTNSAWQYLNSSLQATAPEYVPLNVNQGAIKKHPQRRQDRHQGTDNREETGSNSYQQFGQSNDVKKTFSRRNYQRGGYTDWRSSLNTNNYYRNHSSKNYRYNSSYSKSEAGYTNNFKHREPPNVNETSYNDTSSYYRNSKYKSHNSYKNGNDKPQDSYKNKSKYDEKSNSLHKRSNSLKTTKKIDLTSAGQRERLTDMITNNLLDCLVCCEKIKRTDKVWACMQCYHIIHLTCITAWAKSSQVQENWRCPACQNGYAEIPHQYVCYCGKTVEPKPNANIIAHGCDSLCQRLGKNCDHKCNILCHPGPCPECNVMVSKLCGCGLTQQIVKCCSDIQILCQSICKKLLNCGLHECESACHTGACAPCKEFVIQQCFCKKTERKVSCDHNNAGKFTFSCGNKCEKMLLCGNHNCSLDCHEGDCQPCETDVSIVKQCYCGKTDLVTPRKSCLDPIPCCTNICGKQLICGSPSKPHSCISKCHNGKCPPCPLTTIIKCRCGHMDKEIPCSKVITKPDDARCEKKCLKKRLCGKHTCKQKCCIEIEHVCPLPCNKLLTCGLHRCELTCHSGRCPTCMETSFEELYCECGSSVLYPPVPCGTKPPVCSKPCSKTRPCGHPPNHFCHPGSCPPCFVLTKKWCYGKHEQRATIPCNQISFSCGLACGKPMNCGRHNCNKQCHEGDCPLPCTQPCVTVRALCGHPCNKPCHNPPCLESNCKQMVAVICQCGLQKSQKICTDLSEEYHAIEMAHLKDRMNNLSSYQTIDFTDSATKRPAILKILECNEECRLMERNRRLAIGLQIQNPDLSQKLTPRYSDFLKQWGKRDPKFCQRVHEKLTELVQLAKQSKQKSRAHSFESMNRDKRHFIHEYCQYFGVESAAYDSEPNRNVIATAIKDKSWLPGMSLLEVLQRENGQRRVPGPILGAYNSKQEVESVSLKLLSSKKL